jgi:phage shock protein C
MATKRLYRSKHGDIFGVCKGIAQWKDFPVDLVRLAFILIALFTAIFPCIIVYCVLAFVLPVNPNEDESSSQTSKSYKLGPEDYTCSSDSAETRKQEERQKKENDWDSRFYSGK